MTCFAPCPACKRHVATDETACPFCSAALPDAFRDAVSCRTPRGRLNRAAMLVAGAALVGAEACSNSIAPPYGISPPPPDAGAETGTSDGSANDSVVALYGAAPAPLENAPADEGATKPPPAPSKT